jgi:hypothetical protein
MTKAHEEKLTLAVEVNIPSHEDRKATPLFERTRKQLLKREGAVCWICGCTAEEAGPLEAHHHPVERSLAEMVDWHLFRNLAERGLFGEAVKGFDWSAFDPKNPYTFVDDMTVNGVLLCKAHHTGKDEGIHDMPYPLWVVQKFGREGYKFSDVEIIHHEQESR